MNSHSSGHTILGASMITTLGALPVFLMASQSVQIRSELDFGEQRFGVAVAAFFTAASIATVIGGRIADRVGRRASTIVAGLLGATGGFAMAFAAEGWATLVVCMAMLGTANAACQVTANLAMARSIPPHRRGLGFGIKQSATPGAIMLAGLAVPTVTASLGWRATYVATALGGLLVLGIGLLSRGPVSHPSVKSGRGPDAPPMRALLVIGAATVLAASSASSMATFGASWGFEVGLTPAEAGVVMAAGSALNIVTRILTGHLADRRDGPNLPVVVVQMSVGGLALALLSIPSSATFVPAIVLAFAIGWSWPGLLLFAAARLGRDAPATASGIVQAGAFVGGAVGPMAFGFLVDAVGYQTSWRVAAVMFLLAGSLVKVARRMVLAGSQEPPA